MNMTMMATPSPNFNSSTAQLDRHQDIPATGKVGVDGNIEHNIDLDRYRGADKKAAEGLIEDFALAIGDLKQQAEIARSKGDVTLAKRLDSEANKLSEAFTELKQQLEAGTIDPKVVASAVATAGLDVLVDGLLEAASLSDAEFNMPPAPAGSDSVEDGGKGGKVDEAGEIIGSTAPSETDEGLPANFEKTPRELAEWFESDPQGFFEELRGLKSEDRGAILMMVQGEIQQTNQLFSMMTNFQSAAHDTQKAMISNLRV